MATILTGLFTAQAGNPHYDIPDITINNYYDNPQPPSVTSASNEPMIMSIGISDEDLSEALATALAANHQFDFSTQSWQASVNAAFELSNDNENNVSFGVAKRWETIDALFHASYTPYASDKGWITVGSTWRF